MKVIILSGGFGTRLGEITESIPKPMVKIGTMPILLHLMKYYSKFNFNEFYLALGYKSEVIKNFFINYNSHTSDLKISLENNNIEFISEAQRLDWKINLIDTGLNTMTGGRLRQLRKHLDETFLLTYGDGLSDVDLNELISFHKKHKKLVTVTAVHPNARFGELSLDGKKVVNFEEKPNISEGWINGGFFVMEPEFIDMIDDDHSILEREPLEMAATRG